MSDKTIEFIASASQTFVSSFLMVLGTTLANGDIQWTWAFWGAVGMIALRAAIKAVFQKTTIPALGGKN